MAASTKKPRAKYCRGKVAYKAYTDATKVLRAVKRDRGHDEAVSVYKCKVCSAFHIGHTPWGQLQRGKQYRRLKGRAGEADAIQS